MPQPLVTPLKLSIFNLSVPLLNNKQKYLLHLKTALNESRPPSNLARRVRPDRLFLGFFMSVLMRSQTCGFYKRFLSCLYYILFHLACISKIQQQHKYNLTFMIYKH